ncbi:MAG: hypothetical protein PHN84_08595 [Desulfuromonadaceae bacterium]|nr:hypothetical protein [Desulfuromonadaceae bacterium]MDD2855596.1 hypothetical protein [Desulfuromonadaceae bacterium]
MKRLLLLGGVLSLSMLGCGGSGDDTVGLLATSSVNATIDTLVMDSDVVAWVDDAGSKATACAPSFPSIPAADSVNVVIKSTAYSNTGSMGLPLRIESATITYTPANTDTPAMPPEFQAIGMTIPNGTSATIPVRVATQEQKIALYDVLACNGPIYSYHTTITFNITEIGTDKKITVSSSMSLRFSDFIDK